MIVDRVCKPACIGEWLVKNPVQTVSCRYMEGQRGEKL